jgi:folate-binding protein YgfZ
MISEWKSFLDRAGAVIESERVLHFGDAERELRAAVTGTVVCDLSHFGLLAARGEDTETFLQGQLTNDVRNVSPECSQLAAYCSPKGRTLACLRLFRRGDRYYLRLPEQRLDFVLKRLRLFILRARTSLEDASGELARLGLAGCGAVTALEAAAGVAPPDVDAVAQAGEVSIVRVPGVQPRFEIHGPQAALENLWDAVTAAGAMPVGADPWRLLGILAGVPEVYDTTAEAFVPQMLNLELINGVSFHKGCYTGQEIVARSHYLGKIKRRMYLARAATTACPAPGEALFSPDTDPNQSPGKIVDACRHPDGGCALLVSVLIDCAEGGTVRLAGADGPQLAFEPLPYPLEMRSN